MIMSYDTFLQGHRVALVQGARKLKTSAFSMAEAFLCPYIRNVEDLMKYGTCHV